MYLAGGQFRDLFQLSRLKLFHLLASSIFLFKNKKAGGDDF